MSRLIECCLQNADASGLGAWRASACNVRVAPCLQRCGDCRRGSFVVVEGELTTGENHDALRSRIDGDGNAR